ncbi:hybrid sensor histidine kinase/response regulator [Noviherbaspirillum aerium]|uniref:hybrid sensor histidine kinase/response regulator n=1 Tax=Noviherbaspirillum aerium TaxID=2588497 RepID=UPI00124DF94D|nr:hybrid sensor histidine kinase/response regulator [Noviherbaspirillum aerium]
MSQDINILVVDDVAQNLVAMQALLARDGIRVMTASSGPEALEILLAHEVALALVDVQMPLMDGFELAELIRGSARTRAVPLIFLTAAASEAKTTFRGYEAGAVDFLYKPVDPAALKSKVNVFVELHAKEKQLSRQLEELRQALHMNEMFAAVLGHDLRNPLSSIMMGAEAIRLMSDNPTITTSADRIRSSGDRMTKMVGQLLDVTRIRSDGIRLNPQPLSYLEISRKIVGELAYGRPDKRIDIESRGNCEGMVDGDRLEQIFSNLIGNALQHGEPGTPVQIVIDGSEQRSIVVEVKNGGMMPESVRSHLFKPFHSSLQRRHASQGLGLGLYIVKQFVNAHGGSVELQSTRKAETAIRIVMPR